MAETVIVKQEYVPSSFILPTFDHDIDEWNVYKGRLDQFFTMTNTTDASKKRSVLLSFVGPKTYRILHDMCSPDGPNSKTYTELCELMDENFTPPIVAFRDRKAFYDANRNADEPLQEFLMRLRGLAINCKFANINSMLVDKFVTGNTPKILERLCEEDPATLTIKKALEIALRRESHLDNRNILYVHNEKHKNTNKRTHKGYQNKSKEYNQQKQQHHSTKGQRSLKNSLQKMQSLWIH